MGFTTSYFKKQKQKDLNIDNIKSSKTLISNLRMLFNVQDSMLSFAPIMEQTTDIRVTQRDTRPDWLGSSVVQLNGISKPVLLGKTNAVIIDNLLQSGVVRVNEDVPHQGVRRSVFFSLTDAAKFNRRELTRKLVLSGRERVFSADIRAIANQYGLSFKFNKRKILQILDINGNEFTANDHVYEYNNKLIDGLYSIDALEWDDLFYEYSKLLK